MSSNSINDGNVKNERALDSLSRRCVLGEKYRLDALCGRGGMGVVWKAYELVGERWVALKFVPRDLQYYDEEMERVRRSFRVINELNHQYICPVYALENDPTFGYYLVMKRLKGKTLQKIRDRYFDDKKFPLSWVPKILKPVADALDYAHRRGVVHRDVKPSNILLSIENNYISNVSLIDFGLAAQIRESLTRVTQQRACGSPRYMSPEQWRGRQENAKSDQYALAVVAYELCAGRPPFVGTDMEILRLAVLNEQPEKIDGLSDSINQALLKGLAKEKDKRFDSCADFVAALNDAIKQRKNDARKFGDDSNKDDDSKECGGYSTPTFELPNVPDRRFDASDSESDGTGEKTVPPPVYSKTQTSRADDEEDETDEDVVRTGERLAVFKTLFGFAAVRYRLFSEASKLPFKGFSVFAAVRYRLFSEAFKRSSKRFLSTSKFGVGSRMSRFWSSFAFAGGRSVRASLDNTSGVRFRRSRRRRKPPPNIATRWERRLN